MTKDEFQKAVDDVITDCIRNDYSFGSYAYKVAEAVWPLLEAAEKDIALKERIIDSLGLELNAVANERDDLRAKIAEMEKRVPAALVKWQVGGQVVHIVGNVKPGDILYALPGAKGE